MGRSCHAASSHWAPPSDDERQRCFYIRIYVVRWRELYSNAGLFVHVKLSVLFRQPLPSDILGLDILAQSW